MEITTKVLTKITFTEEEKEAITKFLKIRKEYSDRCGGTIKRSCSGCPFYEFCDTDIVTLKDFEEALEVEE